MNFITVCIVFGWLLVSSVVAEDAHVSCREICDIYIKESQQKHNYAWQSQEEYIQWHGDWLERLIAVASDNETESKEYHQILAYIVGLANGVQNYEVSLEFINRLIDNESIDAQLKLRWYVEESSISAFQFWNTKKLEDKEASIKASSVALSKLEQFRSGVEKKSVIYTQLTKNLADVCQTLGRVSATIAVCDDNNNKTNVEQAANSFAKSAMYFAELSEINQLSEAQKNDMLMTLREEAKTYAKIGLYDKNFEVLRSIKNFSQNKTIMPISFFVIECAHYSFPISNEDSANYLLSWKDKNEGDDYTPILIANVGHAFFHVKKYSEAKKYYESVIDNVDTFVKYQKRAFEEGSGGDYSRLLQNLSVIYSMENNVDKSLYVNELFIKMFPNQGDSVKRMQASIPYFREQKENRDFLENLQKNENKTGYPFLIMLIITTALIFLFLLSRVIKKFSKR
jgi:tetratricopeptide (TPR) repeat protein